MLSNKGITPLKAIKKHCLECSGYDPPNGRAGKKQVRECVIKDCVLFPFRQGFNPNRKGCTVKKLSAVSIQLLAKQNVRPKIKK